MAGRDAEEAWKSQIVENAEALRRAAGQLEMVSRQIEEELADADQRDKVRVQLAEIRRVESELRAVDQAPGGHANAQAWLDQNIEALEVIAAKAPPAILNNDDRHVSCAVVLKIGDKRVRVLLDTGAVRSMMDKEVAEMMRNADPQTKGACMAMQPLSKPMNCEGAEKSKVIGVVEWTMMVRVRLVPPEIQRTEAAKTEGGSPALRDVRNGESEKNIDCKFYLMENLSDPIILGRPELQQLGLFLEPPDEDGRLWVQFTSYNLRLPVIMPGNGSRKVFKVDEPKILQGPDLQSVPVVISESDYKYYTH